MVLEFFIPLKEIPTVTHQQKRVGGKSKNGKTIFYEDERLSGARELFMSRLHNFKPKTPLTGNIELITTWCFSETKNKKHGTPMVDTPDLDNIQKLFNDCLTKSGFWKDDKQVFRMILEKYHSEVVGIRIKIREVE